MTDRRRPPSYTVQGGAVLRGSVRISGAKNAALAFMCAALLSDEPVTLENVPAIRDEASLSDLLVSLGAKVTRPASNTLTIDASRVNVYEAPSELITENRASFQVMGPLLARHGYASSVPPGGDVIGQRPIDVHLGGFEAMGATVTRLG